MSLFRIGIIGMGTISHAHIEAVSELEDVSVVAVSDIKDREALDIPEGASFFSDYRKMIDTASLDAVHICLPHYLHKEASEYAASHGVNVLCEKPVAMNRKEAESMASFQDRYGVTVAVCFQNRWNNTFRTLLDISKSGREGKLLGIKGELAWARDESYYSAAPWRGQMKYAGGGCLINQAIHTLDEVMMIGGSVRSVKGVVANIRDLGIEVEDTATANIDFENGARAVILVTNANTINSSVEIEAAFEKAVYTIKDYKLYRADASNPINKELIATDELRVGGKSYYGAGHRALIKDFYSYLRDGSGTVVSVSEASQSVKLIDAIRLSSEEGRAIEWSSL